MAGMGRAGACQDEAGQGEGCGAAPPGKHAHLSGLRGWAPVRLPPASVALRLHTAETDGGDAVRRTIVLAILIGLVLGAVGHRVLADEAASTSGTIGATQQEADEGYFALGSDTMVVVKPGSALHGWLRSHIGQNVRLTMAPESQSEE